DDDPDGEVDVLEDLESILDEMRVANIPERTLNLHYRSRRESLIAFSNSRYYENRLITFPAPAALDCGVQLIRPEGFYARGKARHNIGEARAVVSEIMRRLTHEKPEIRDLSIGVVTFNSEQQSLIENLLDEERSKNPDIEWAFSSDNILEPVFVKNLETVQGDERDVILFSVTYGPDQSGHVTMNFGPLNKTGGERRLNVALTRSRSEMLVFSTLTPDRIDLSRTRARAVEDLKHFLQYAEYGLPAIGEAVTSPAGDCESPFESAVTRALRDKGWIIHPQVGVSAYRIDLGVVHPDEPGVYLAGIECDGAMYHSSAYARERDKIRQFVLEKLGWTLFRVWSTDWWTNRAGSLEKLHQSLLSHLEDDRRKREKAAQSQTAAKEAAEQETLTNVTDQMDETGELLTSNPESSGKETEKNNNEHQVEAPPSDDDIQPSTPPIRVSGKIPTPAQPPEEKGEKVNFIREYSIARFNKEQFHPEPDQFYSDEYASRLTDMINLVIDIEGPIHEDVLARRIARHHGFKRAGRQIRDIIIRLASQNHKTTEENTGLFFWSNNPNKERLIPSRYKNRDNEMRKIDYICKEEILAINFLLSLNGDPVEFSRRIGISRLSQNARQRLVDILGKP
ncbi:MAG: DUF3320 domain-containing protein, partial [Candidatus Hinthialibacter sp.]